MDVPTRTGATRTVRTYLKVIMENDESRKIFYFLMVNLAYMVIQLLWGFWTNSLGLVSDGKLSQLVGWELVLMLTLPQPFTCSSIA